MSIHPDRAQMVRAAAAQRRRPDDDTPVPEIGSIHRARVTSIREFGAFIELVNGAGLQGLVHISELSQSRVELVRDLVDVGELVWVKLIGVKEAPRRLSFSMKYCEQSSGRDLDPNEVKLSMARSGQKSVRLEPGPVVVGAVLDTTCSRCGVHGHTTKECFADLAADRYELIPEFPPEEDLVVEAPVKRKKQRRPDDRSAEAKHRKKSKKRVDSAADSLSPRGDRQAVPHGSSAPDRRHAKRHHHDDRHPRHSEGSRHGRQSSEERHDRRRRDDSHQEPHPAAEDGRRRQRDRSDGATSPDRTPHDRDRPYRQR